MEKTPLRIKELSKVIPSSLLFFWRNHIDKFVTILYKLDLIEDIDVCEHRPPTMRLARDVSEYRRIVDKSRKRGKKEKKKSKGIPHP